MRFLSTADITASISSSDYFMTKIDIDKRATKKLIKEISDKGLDGEALSVLNTLGQNIEYIDTKSYTYKHLGEELAFSDLSRGEQVFLISYAAKISGETLYLQHEMKQLTKTALRKYFKEFKDCNNIVIIYTSESEFNYYKYVMSGRIK